MELQSQVSLGKCNSVFSLLLFSVENLQTIENWSNRKSLSQVSQSEFHLLFWRTLFFLLQGWFSFFWVLCPADLTWRNCLLALFQHLLDLHLILFLLRLVKLFSRQDEEAHVSLKKSFLSICYWSMYSFSLFSEISLLFCP